MTSGVHDPVDAAVGALGRATLAHAGASDEVASTALIFAAVWITWIAWSRLRGKAFPRLPRWAGWALLPVSLGLVAAAVTVPQTVLGPTPVPAPTRTRPASTANLSFREPTAGEAIRGSELAVVLKLDGGSVLTQTATDLRPDEGHVHLRLDGRPVSMTYGTLQPIDISGLQPGTHELEAEFVAADHAPFDPRVTADVRFEVAP